ncbi:hypothetical protein HYC85_007937 [Camellia sinensis]|uniref:Uncharacterized protein n=1 Tax=Camellia sinensis TaxID=4442 RepID=A0A7J7HS82_CAMSI|nr:hypothetical protein HYC85_007937 [Camellia sinensis]
MPTDVHRLIILFTHNTLSPCSSTILGIRLRASAELMGRCCKALTFTVLSVISVSTHSGIDASDQNCSSQSCTFDQCTNH